MCSFEYDDEVGYADYRECEDCREANDRLFFIERKMAEVVKLLYSTENLDTGILDDTLGQICDSLGFQLPPTGPKVCRKYSEIFQFAASINQ